MRVQLLQRFQLRDGIKHLMLVMFLIMLFQKFSWQFRAIYAMILMGKYTDLTYKLFKIETINTIHRLIFVFSVHPRTKHDVGYRLSRSGLAVAYGQQVEFQGPIVQNVTYTNGSSVVNITYTAVSSIEVRNPNGFEVRIKFSSLGT